MEILFLCKRYENTWQSLSVVLRRTTQMFNILFKETQMYNIKAADKKVACVFVLC